MFSVTFAIAAVLLALTMHAQEANPVRPSKPMRLTAEDYVEIHQLIERYAFALDTCSNSGYDYADLYVEDGEFRVAADWGSKAPPRFTAKGRDALAAAAGGGKNGCGDPTKSRNYGISHITVNHVITPAPGGATGMSYSLAIGVEHDPRKIERQGGYEDVYVKTPNGWRIKSRTHVVPNVVRPVQSSTENSAPTASPAPPSPQPPH
jgi:hypothetical protein